MRKIVQALLIMSICSVSFAIPSLGGWEIGAAGTTHQVWIFDDDTNPALPEVDQNPYGTASVAFSHEPIPGYYKSTEFEWKQSHNAYITEDGRTFGQGVWAGDPVNLAVTVPNSDSNTGYKEIHMEIGFQAVYYSGYLMPDPEIVPSDRDQRQINYSTELLKNDVSWVQYPDTDWRVMKLAWRIEPNPGLETVLLSFAGTGGFVDYIVCDTICTTPAVPAPSAIGLGLLGLIAARKYRKRVSR